MPNILKYMKTLIAYALIAVVTLICLDTLAYMSGIKNLYFPTIKGRLTYPDGYFKSDNILGHDITPSHPAVEFDWRDMKAEISSNQFGCFDANSSYSNPLIYLAGDSVTWGYAEYDKKFGFLIEKKLGVNVAKCGVTHTGQRHQIAKLQKFINQTSVKPNLIIVTWVRNDPDNDFLFPQATVIRGKFADQAMLAFNGKKPIRATIPEIDARMRNYEDSISANSNHQHSLMSKVISFLKTYSISANIIRGLASDIIGSSLRAALEPIPDEYSRSLIESANRQAIKDFISFADGIGAEIIFLVYSTSTKQVESTYDFIKNMKQHVINFPAEMHKKNVSAQDIIWPIDGHPNNKGNAYIAEILINYIKNQQVLVD